MRRPPLAVSLLLIALAFVAGWFARDQGGRVDATRGGNHRTDVLPRRVPPTGQGASAPLGREAA